MIHINYIYIYIYNEHWYFLKTIWYVMIPKKKIISTSETQDLPLLFENIQNNESHNHQNSKFLIKN
jgi:hypothetical protein